MLWVANSTIQNDAKKKSSKMTEALACGYYRISVFFGGNLILAYFGSPS